MNSIIEILLEHSQNKPDLNAYRFINDGQETCITNAEFGMQVMGLADYIKRQTKPGDRVLLVYPPSVEYIVAFYACLLARTIAVPVYPPASKELVEKIQHIISDAKPSLVLSSSDIVTKIKQLGWIKTLKNIPLINKLLNTYIDNKFDTEWNFDSFRWVSTDKIKPVGQLNPDHFELPKAQDLAFLQYTSGSTGNPKGVMVSHGNIIDNQILIKKGFGLSSDDVIANWLPPYHDMGLIGAVIQPLFLGTEGILMSPFHFVKRPSRWLQMISKYGVNVSGGPNFSYGLCLTKISDKDLADLDLSSWRVAFCGAEPISQKVFESFAKRFESVGFRKKAFLPCYGLAEATLMVSCGPYETVEKVNDGIVNPIVDCGTVYQPVKIVDPERLEVRPEGEIGEIWISGSSVAQGYWNKDDINESMFRAQISQIDDFFFRTGDLGYIKDNHLFPIGRIKDLIIVNGKNYFPADIEDAVSYEFPQLKKGTAVAFSIPGTLTERVIFVCQLNKNLTREEQIELLKSIYTYILSTWQIECYDIVLLYKNPINKTTSGKLQRFKVRQRYLNNELESTSCLLGMTDEDKMQNTTVPDTTPILEQSQIIELLSKCVSKVLLEARVRTDKPLAQYGMNSIKAVELAGILEEELKQDIDPSIFYNFPTIEQLAKYLSGKDTELTEHVLPTSVSSGDIAIIGMACRLPNGIKSPEEFWDFLLNKGNAITSAPEDRWNIKEETNIPPFGGFMQDVQYFDEEFFNITDNEAKFIDPQQRLTLEEIWHAFENAGIPPESLRGQNVGLFIGASNSDYARLILEQGIESPYLGSGNALSAIAGRAAYTFGFHGPCMTIDTACSSSLAAVHQAALSLKQGECCLAVAGGVNVILTTDLTRSFNQAKMLSPDGCCKTFSDDANGYVRSEGIGFVILKPLAAAIRDKNPIHAVLKASHMNQDGMSNGLTAPNGLAQQALIKKCLQLAELKPEDIDYIECHGTGTPLGDPIEVDSISSVLVKNQKERPPLVLGAVKTNLGHLESASGIAGLIKSVLALKNDLIPANLHFKELNHHINTHDLPITFPNEHVSWQKEQGTRYVGINSFGFTGTNVHVILSEYPKPRERKIEAESPSLLILSAKNEHSLALIKASYQELLQSTDIDLHELCADASKKRQHFDYRIAVSASNRKELYSKLLQAIPTVPVLGQKKILAFLFTGQGAQYTGMGKLLYSESRTFREHITYCDRLLEKKVGFLLMDAFFSDENNLIEQSKYIQPLLFILEYSLAKMWSDWGLVPDYVAGHSLGLYSAACFSGIISVEEALDLVTLRGGLMDDKSPKGSMLALMASLDTTNELLQRYGLRELDVAAINTNTQTVVAGPSEEINKLIEYAKKDDVRTKVISNSHAFHSKMMKPILPSFDKVAQKIKYKTGNIPLILDLNGDITDTLNAEYLREQICSPIHFMAVSNTLIACGCNTFIEIGPQPVLCNFVGVNSEKKLTLMPSLSKHLSDKEQILQTLQQLYLLSFKINWNEVYTSNNVSYMSLPYYPFKKQRHWITGNKRTKAKKTILKKSEPLKKQVVSWLELPFDQRTSYLKSCIKEEIYKVSGMDKSKIIDENEHFFAIGIDSLMLVQIFHNLNSITQQANIEIEIEHIQQPTINSVIEYLNALLDKHGNHQDRG